MHIAAAFTRCQTSLLLVLTLILISTSSPDDKFGEVLTRRPYFEGSAGFWQMMCPHVLDCHNANAWSGLCNIKGKGEMFAAQQAV